MTSEASVSFRAFGKFEVFLLALVLALPGCGREAVDSPVGVWEIRYQDAVGQSYLDVLELRADGSYTTHMQGVTPSDTGRYELTQDAIAFHSNVDPLFSRDVPFTLPDSGTLSLMVAPLESAQRVYVEWRRSSLARKLQTIELNTQNTPRALPAVVAALHADVRRWHDDAVPTAIRLEAQPNAEFSTVLHFLSPGAAEELRVKITPFDSRSSTHDGGRAASRPLPVEFLDLPDVLEAADEQGAGGAIESAHLQVWGTHGAVWQVQTASGASLWLSAADGRRLDGDVTGYVDQYEADWESAGELWREAADRWKLIEDIESWPNCDSELEYECLDQGCAWNEPSAALPNGSCVPYY